MENLRTISNLFIFFTFSALILQAYSQQNTQGQTSPQNTENQNSPNAQQNSNDISSICKVIPFNHITPCVSKCKTCPGVGPRNQCSSCPADFQLSPETSECVIPPGHTYYQQNFFMSEDFAHKGDINNFYTSSGLLTTMDITSLCIAEIYKFQIAGLFYANQQIIHDISFPREIDYISLHFRLFSITEAAKVTIQINNKNLFTQSYNGGEIKVTYNSTANQPLALIQSDPTQFLDSIFIPVHTGFIPISGFSAQIKISVNCPSNTPCWGFSQMLISGRKCPTCVSEQVKLMQKVLGIIVGTTAAILAVLIIFLFMHNLIVERRRKGKMHERIEKILWENHEQQQQLQKYQSQTRQIEVSISEMEIDTSKQIIETPSRKKFSFF